MSLQFHWAGPHRTTVDPRWGGPHAMRDSSMAATDPLFVYALCSMGEDILATTKRPMVVSPNSETTWSGTKPTDPKLETADVTNESRLRQCSPAVRSDIIGRELLAAISVNADVNTARLSTTVGARDISTLHAPGSRLTTDLDEVKKGIKDKSRQERVPELWAQDQDLLAFLTAPLGIVMSTHPFTFEVVNVATGVLGAVLHTAKHRFNIHRPYTVDPTVLPTVPLPGHQSYPGGHSAYGHLCAALLVTLVNKKNTTHAAASTVAASLERIVELTADSRVVAGLHYPIDTHAGEVLGKSFGSWLGAAGSMHFATINWTPMSFTDPGGGKKMQRTYGTHASGTADLPSWRWLVHQAAAEW